MFKVNIPLVRMVFHIIIIILLPFKLYLPMFYYHSSVIEYTVIGYIRIVKFELCPFVAVSGCLNV